MNLSSKTWRRRVFWPRLAQTALALACVYALLIGWDIEPY